MAGRGGARPNSGPKKKLIPPHLPGAATPEARRRSAILYEALVRPASPVDSLEVQHWRRYTDGADAGIASQMLWRLFEHSEGRAVHTVNHLHDKPIEMTVTHTISERYRIALEKAEKRVSQQRS